MIRVNLIYIYLHSIRLIGRGVIRQAFDFDFGLHFFHFPETDNFNIISRFNIFYLGQSQTNQKNFLII